MVLSNQSLRFDRLRRQEYPFVTNFRMKYALIITGIIAALALAAPKLVVLGYLFLILPGLILTIAPTVFVYLAATAVIRKLLPISSSVMSTVAAFAIALFLGWAIMQPFRLNAIAAFDENELPDVVPVHAIELGGNIRLERQNHFSAPDCDYLTLAVLDAPPVKSVTTVTAGRKKPSKTLHSAAYVLASARMNPAVGIIPHEPGQIVRKYLPLCRSSIGKKLVPALKAVEANWAIRLTQDERLREAEPITAESADWVIRIDDKFNQQTSVRKRITISDSGGTVRFRKSYRRQAIPARMFYIGFEVSMGSGTVSGASFHLGRQILKSGKSSLNLESALLQAIKFTVPPCDPAVIEVLQQQVKRALEDPSATAAQLDLARRYLGLFFFDTKPQDHALIARIVADERVIDIDAEIENTFSKNKTPVAMRDAFVDRIAMPHTSANLRHWLAERLANLPPGTFADPNKTYRVIWKSPKIYQEAAPMIATLADINPKHAMPLLMKTLDNAIALPNWNERRTMINAIQAALIRMGPQASAAAPKIQKLFLQRPSPITKNAKDAAQWRFALARMGVAIEDLPVYPNQSPESVRRNSQKVAKMLKRYEQANTAQQKL